MTRSEINSNLQILRDHFSDFKDYIQDRIIDDQNVIIDTLQDAQDNNHSLYAIVGVTNDEGKRHAILLVYDGNNITIIDSLGENNAFTNNIEKLSSSISQALGIQVSYTCSILQGNGACAPNALIALSGILERQEIEKTHAEIKMQESQARAHEVEMSLRGLHIISEEMRAQAEHYIRTGEIFESTARLLNVNSSSPNSPSCNNNQDYCVSDNDDQTLYPHLFEGLYQ